MHILVTAASRHGSTAGIAQAIGETLRSRGLTVALVTAGEVGVLEGFDAVVLGSAVYAGHWLPEAISLADRTASELPGRPVWLFSSGPVGDPSRKLVQQMAADPVDLPRVLTATRAREHRVFPGRLDRGDLRRVERAALILVRGVEGDFRDWQAVKTWAESIADELVAAAA